MKLDFRSPLTLSGIALVLSLGCAAQDPFAPVSLPDTARQSGGPKPYQQLANSFPDQRIIGPNQQVVTPTVEKPSLGKRFLTSLDNATDTISTAFQPKRIPAADPVSLATPTPRVGADLHYHAGRVHEKNRDIDRAKAHYERAINTDPKDIRSLVGLARVSDQSGDLPRAESLYRQAVEQAPENAGILNDLGLCYAKQGKLDAAIETLRLAVEKRPQNARYRNNIAAILINARRPDEAFQQMAVVHGIAAAHYNVGFLLWQQGDKPRARHHLLLAVQNEPQLHAARHLLTQLAADDTAPLPHIPERPVYPSTEYDRYAPASAQGAAMRSLPPL